MQRLRRYLPPLLILLPVIFICGKLLLTPVIETVPSESQRLDSEMGLWCGNYWWESVRDYGWPWVFWRKRDSDGGFLSPSTIPSAQISWGLLAADLLVLSAPILVTVFLLICHYRRNRAWLRFSLGELLSGFTVCAVAFGWLAQEYHEWQREQAACEQFDYLFEAGESRGLGWMRRLWPWEGRTIFDRNTSIQVDLVGLARGSADDLIVALHAMLYVEEVSIGYLGSHSHSIEPPKAELRQEAAFCDKAKDVSVLRRIRLAFDPLKNEHIAILKSWSAGVTSLRLRDIELDDDQLLDLIGELTSLEELDVEISKQPSNAMVIPLANLRRLRTLAISNATLTVEGLKLLQQLPELENLSLKGWYDDDDALELLKIENLKTLQLNCFGQLSEKTVRLLKAKIPSAVIE